MEITTRDEMTSATHPSGWAIALGVLLIVAGIVAIAAPFFAGVAVSLVFGWLILMAGVAHLVYAWSERGAGAVILQVLIGIVYLFAAYFLLTRPVGGVAALTLILGF